MASRQTIPQAMRQTVLLEAGYKCANPTCRHILTLEMHHIVWVKDGGDNTPENLIALCPNCHTLHTRGHIPAEAIVVWKGVLVSLMNPNKVSADFLLTLDDDERRVETAPDPKKEPAKFRFTGDSLGFLAGLLASDLVEISRRYSGHGSWGSGMPSFEVRLTPSGRALVEAWKAGNAQRMRRALGYENKQAGTNGGDNEC